MNISDERLQAMAKEIGEGLLQGDFLSADDPRQLMAAIHKAMVKYVHADEGADAKVRAKIVSLKRNVPEGSREWDILYQQYYDQELDKR